MDRDGSLVLAGLALVAGAVGFVGLTVYPYQYSVVESAVLVGVFVLLALGRTVLDGATFRT